MILGVRPENFEDAALVPADDRRHGITFAAPVDVIESMGSDVFAYFTVEGERATSAELDELAADSGRADLGAPQDQIVARLDAASRVGEGEARLWVDTRSIHVFDLETGANLTLGCRNTPDGSPPASERDDSTAPSVSATAPAERGTDER